jgi:hypothetical protein
MCWAWRCRTEIHRGPNDPLRLFSRSGRPSIGLTIELVEAVAEAPEGLFFSLKVLFPVFYPHTRTHR